MKILKARSRKNRIIKGLRDQNALLQKKLHLLQKKLHHRIMSLKFQLHRANRELVENRGYQEGLLEKLQPRTNYINELEDRVKVLTASEMELLEIKRKYYSLIRTLKI